MTAKVHLGTQGWSYPDWNGVFYPPGSKQEDRLPFYASVFDTVELDTTFYHAPKGTIARSWERHTPADFRFAAKLPRAITHDALLRDAGEALVEFARARSSRSAPNSARCWRRCPPSSRATWSRSGTWPRSSPRGPRT